MVCVRCSDVFIGNIVQMSAASAISAKAERVLHRPLTKSLQRCSAADMGGRHSRPRRFTPTIAEEIAKNNALLAATKSSYETDALMSQVRSVVAVGAALRRLLSYVS